MDAGCILTDWPMSVGGYGRRNNVLAHRAAWIAANGPIPDGLCVCHRCEVRRCVNVDHLFLQQQAVRRIASPLDRLHARMVQAKSGCWEWTGASDGRRGYGMISYQNQRWSTHRLMWALTNGPIPDGMHVLHRCDNPPCMNPDHLWLGTALDNCHDKLAKGRANHPPKREFCQRGHSEWYVEKDGHRQCRGCGRERERGRDRRRVATR